LARGATAATIAARGTVRVEGLVHGDWPVALAPAMGPLAPGPVIVAVKAYDLEDTLRALAPRLGTEHEVMLLQNGLGVRSAGERVLGRAVTRGVTFLAAERLAPAEVRFNAAGKTYVPQSSTGAALWREADLPCDTVADIDLYVWRKLAINAVINPLSALLGVENGALVPLAGTSRALVEELTAVARAHGIALDAQETLEKVFASIQQTARNPSSMLQDLRNGRPTEIDWINGAIVRAGESAEVGTPRHRLLTELVRFAAERARAARQS
jgi:2-dehydropantoate 2-reductase